MLSYVVDIYDHSKTVKKSKAVTTVSRILGRQSLLTMIDKPLHRSRRRLISQGFSSERLAEFQPIMLAHIRTFCDQLLATTDACRDWWTWNRNVKAWCKLLLHVVYHSLTVYRQVLGSHLTLVESSFLGKIFVH